MAFFLRHISLGTREPARHHVVGGLLAIGWCDATKGSARHIELAETQGGRGEVQLAVEPRIKPCDLCTPGNGLGAILFFRDVGEDARGGERIWINRENLARQALGFRKIVLRKPIAGFREEPRFLPTIPPFADGREGKKANAKTEHDKKRENEAAAQLEAAPP